MKNTIKIKKLVQAFNSNLSHGFNIYPDGTIAYFADIAPRNISIKRAKPVIAKLRLLGLELKGWDDDPGT